VLERVARKLGEKLNEPMILLSDIFARQFSAIAAQRLRRAAQIVVLYRNLGYDRRLIRDVIERLGRGFTKMARNKPLYLLFGAAMFTWDQNKVTEEELESAAEEITYMRHDSGGSQSVTGSHLDAWEKVIDKAHLTAWRKPVPNSYLYEYKVYGSYDDLPARAFYTAQVDLEFRKKWDKLVISLDVVDQEKESDTELVQWIMHFPYPMYSREYLYVRRCKIDTEKKLMIIINRSVDHPSYPVDKNYVRVDTYMSKMVIRPHTSFDENGFDYVLSYFDDPKSSFPSLAYNWMASTGVPDFVDKVHTAAMHLHERRNRYLAGEEEHVKEGLVM